METGIEKGKITNKRRERKVSALDETRETKRDRYLEAK